ncbi:hypothetical protein D9K80_03395 [Acinetobacter cumulans]|uniref:DUF4431 domain-containing protein n=2 Tax=Moraxellaceae TaxID=468 RepID=A0A498CZ76_9GAMM|nr:hypothetical protein DYI81_08970 [Acinetobacter sp. SWAC5]RLL37612.1 hypothetical protein D9K80_03395 [Acinetobacter cumulans]
MYIQITKIKNKNMNYFNTISQLIMMCCFVCISTSSFAKTKAKTKQDPIIVHAYDLQKQYSFSPNSMIEVQSISEKPILIHKVVINKGACLVLPDNKPVELYAYGQISKYMMGGGYTRNITAIEVYVDNSVIRFPK